MFRQSLREVIHNRFPELDITEAQNANEGLQKAIQDRPQLIVTDLQLNGLMSFQMIQKIAQEQPDAHIAVLTDKDEEEYRKVALAKGADYFLSKTNPNEQSVLTLIKRRLIDA